MSSQTTLERVDIEEIKRATSSNLDGEPLHVRASKVLGYRRTRLVCELATIGIAPFVSSSVDRYKEAEKDAFKTRYEFSTALKRLTAGVIVLLGLSGALLYQAINTTGWISTILWSVGAAVPIVGLGVLLYFVREEVYLGEGVMIEKASWKRRQIGSYTGEIPMSVVQQSVSIMESIPDATIYIDALETDRRPLDPFLVVHLGGEYAYIEVWDEPRFDGKKIEV